MADAREMRLVSVVVPLCNEEGTVRELHARVCAALGGTPFELLLVDDASTDSTGAVVGALAEADPRVRVIHLSRNFGHQAALTADCSNKGGDPARSCT
jgi:dolichol-phosphate mannosyltransferase